jgi:hypothetical protein
MQSAKSTKKSPQLTDKALAVPETAAVADTPKPRKRAVKAAGASESKLVATSAPKAASSAKSSKSSNKTGSDKAAPKTTHHSTAQRTGQRAAEPVAEAAAVAVAAPQVLTSNPITPQQIAELAYSYYEARGYRPGHHHEDWIRAERELRSRL